MKLRQLQLKDAPLMNEWMHDENVIEFLNPKFRNKTVSDCENFIKNSFDDKNNIALAIVNENDEYMGTVSLKEVDYKEGNAEFAISVRSIAMSKGYSWFGMYSIIDKAFNELKLKTIYWCVSTKNVRAYKFYVNHGFKLTNDVPYKYLDNYKEHDDLAWFKVTPNSFYEERNKLAPKGCKVLNIKTSLTDGKGKLSFFESKKDIPFDIKRIYYIDEVSEGIKRGFHAHKALKQFIFCPYGKINLLLDDGKEKCNIVLDKSNIGVYIDATIWREMIWFESNSVLVVAASEYYDEADYIRDYGVFKEYIKEK